MPVHIPVLGNSLAIGIVSLLHIAFASVAVAFMILAPVTESLGRHKPHYTELARSLTRFTLVTYTTSVVLAVIMIELLIGLFPLTNSWLFNRFRVPITFALGAFLLQLLVLYPYYHFWQAIRAWSVGVHILMGTVAAILVLVWVGVLDGIGSYMLTPVEQTSWHAVYNPTWIGLVLHRFVGNLIVGGFLLAGYAAWRLPRAGTNQDYYQVCLHLGMMVGMACLVLQPFTGWFYARAIAQTVPVSYQQVVQGRYQGFVYLQFVLVGLLLIGSHIVIHGTSRFRARGAILATVVLCLSVILMVAMVGHPDARRFWTFAAVLILAWSIRAWQPILNHPSMDEWRSPWVRYLVIGLAIVSLSTYLTMGTIRETARLPDTIHDFISLTEDARAQEIIREAPHE
ncbi:MAG: cytochrome ubiquinol oxidase subunit I [Nitrospirota bacterium]|nr:cytochrome ubiquinol oxidase subunit I [Nitrospirota bacterium]